MVEDETYVGQVLQGVAGDLQALARPAPTRAFYVFFSFDLENSTVYKTVNPGGWPLVTRTFYELIENGLNKHVERVRLWKYVGDELLLYKRARNHADVAKCIRAASELLHDTVERLHDRFPATRTVLSIKATIWCALVEDLPPDEMEKVNAEGRSGEGHLNILIRQAGGPEAQQIDFLGPDIDIGFRISKFAARRRLVVSADLAYLLYRERALQEGIEDKLRVVSYEQLKGVWGERHYPVIWYEPEWATVASSFRYDEGYQNSIIARLKKGEVPEPLKSVVRVLDDLDRKNDADALWQFLGAEAGEGEDEEFQVIEAREGLEFHCAAVCVREDGRALVALRGLTKRRFPGHWEFGCGQLAPGESFEQCLRRSYSEDFGAELEFGPEPIPVRAFAIEDSDTGRSIPGMIFVAKVTNPEQLSARRHTKIDWVDPTSPDLGANAKKVPSFDLSLRVAGERWKEIGARTKPINLALKEAS